MLHSVKDLQGDTFLATDGEIGTAHDGYFDEASWTVRYLVADTGGWLTGRRVLIPVVALGAAGWRSGQLAVALTREQIRHSPDIDTDQPISRHHEAEHHRYYGYPFYWGGAILGAGMGAVMYALGLPVASAPTAADDEPPDSAAQAGGDTHLRSLREVVGAAVRAPDGAIGHVADLLVDNADWAIRWLVVETGNRLLGGHPVLVSPGWIASVDWDQREVAIDLRREEIEHGPTFDPAAPVEREYETGLFDYYRRPGYWR